MIDWNKNGKMDPVDVGISIAAEEGRQDAGDETKPAENKKNSAAPGCLLLLLSLAAIAALPVLL